MGTTRLYTSSSTENELLSPDAEQRSTSKNNHNMSRRPEFSGALLHNQSHAAIRLANTRQDPATASCYATAQTTWPFAYAKNILCYLPAVC
jgi:hypothetical protein